MLTGVILQENVYPWLNKPTANIDSLIAAAKAKYPTVDMNKLTDLLKVQFYKRNQNWGKFQPAIMNFVKKYETEVTPAMLNSFAWTVFNNCKDVDCINAALAWSKRSVEETQEKEPMFLDTYANLLYRLGKKEEAITMQQKALDLVPAKDKAEYQTTLDRMKKGE